MDKETAPFESVGHGSDDEWDYEPQRRGRVLWGRLIALLIALLLAFLVGRATAGGGGVSNSRYSQVRRELADARATIAAQGTTPAPTQTSPSPSPSASDTTSPAAGTTYIVKPGDTLRGIAIKFYGDASLVTLIESANNISDPTLVHQGTKLIIPPQP